MNNKTLTKDAQETKRAGKKLAKRLRFNKKGAAVVALVGDLGSGKTTFVQGFARGIGVKEKILSPTFVILKKFKINADLRPNSCKFANLYHIDCYRISKPEEILTLGFKEIASIPQNIILIEWADKIKKFLSEDTVWVKFKFTGKNERLLLAKGEKRKAITPSPSFLPLSQGKGED
jgi:tRNA threonylcarbamoyladenosine biosynthesis protein TsaE